MRASKQRWVLSALVRPALWFCACNLLVTAVSAQCTNPTQVPNGTYTSGDHSQVDNNALRASSFAVSQGATATFAAGNCIHLGPGFRANAVGATVPTTFHAWVDIAPTAISFSPSNQSGMSQPFTWTVASPSGTGNLSHVFALFHTTSSTTANACYIHYDPASNLLYLANNASDNWLGGFAPGSGGSASNSQCSISGSGASVSTAGTQLTVQAPVTFQSSFSGTKNEYLYALDGSGVTTGWQQMGTWTVPAPPAPDFTFTAVNDSYYVQTGAYSYPAYTLAITPQNGFNSPVSFSMSWPMYGCGYPSYNPATVTGPPWTTTVSMQCYETLQNGYWTTVTATGGGKSHQVYLYLYVTQNPQSFLTTSVSPVGGGSVSPGSGWYNTGSNVTITATPASGYAFSAFAGVDSSSGSTGYVTMNGNRSVTAIFAQLSQVAAPSFNPAGGTYTSTQKVTIATATGGASIRYTVDGTTPSSTVGTLYTGAVSVASTMTHRLQIGNGRQRR